jgi:hypothetical protein
MTEQMPPVPPPAAPWSPPVPVTVAPKRSRPFLAALTAGGGLVVLGTFMPWATITTVFGTITKAGIDTPDGVFMLILGGVLIAIGLAAHTHLHVPKGLRVVGIIAGTITGLAAIGEATSVSTHLASVTSNPYASAAVGGGVYLLVTGAVIAFFGALAAGWDKPGDGT